MITIIRYYFKSSSHIVLWLIIFAFIIGLLPVAIRQVTQSSIWAIKVNGQEIGYQEYLLERERQKEHILAFREKYGEYADLFLSFMGASDPQVLAIRTLVKQELMNQFSDKIGIHISDNFIAQKMNDPLFVQQELSSIIPIQLVSSTGIDEKMLGRYLKHLGISADLFERQIERLLIEKLMTELIGITVYVPEFDIRQKAIATYAKKSFSVLKISLNHFLNIVKKDPISEAGLISFYEEQNKKHNRYMIPEKRSGRVWEFDVHAYPMAITDEQIEAYYENNKIKKYIDIPATIEVKHILFSVSEPSKRALIQQKAAKVKETLRHDPSRFAQLAQEFSDDQKSASQGGLLKPFTRGSQELPFDQAAFLLKNDGDISDVIETTQGFEIIQRVNKQAQTFKPLHAVKQEIKENIQRQEFRKKFTADAKTALESQETLTSFIKEKKALDKELKDLVLDETMITQHLFKISPGGTAFFIEGDKGFLVRLDSIQEKYIPLLEKVKQEVIDDYYTYKAELALQEALKQAKDEMLKHKTLKEIQKNTGGEIMHTGWISQNEQKTLDSLKQEGALVEKMLQMEKIGSIVTSSEKTDGFLARLDEIEPLEGKELQEKMTDIKGAFEEERAEQYLEGFVASLYRNATIETNESVVNIQL